MNQISITLISIGVLLILIGLVWNFTEKLPLGKLPGDITIEKTNFKFYFPITTSIVISIILTLILWFFFRCKN